MNTTPDAAPTSPAPARGARLSAADWAQVALDVIAEQGVSAVAVEPLARRLGVILHRMWADGTEFRFA